MATKAGRASRKRRRWGRAWRMRMAVLGASMFAAGGVVGVAAGLSLAPSGSEDAPTQTASAPAHERSADEPAGADRDTGAASRSGPERDSETQAPADAPAAATSPTVTDGPEQAPREMPRWRQHAAPVPAGASERPRIAIVIDDMGLDAQVAERAIALPAPVTLSFLTYAPEDNLRRYTREARQAGHEVMAHVPMEPGSASANPGPHPVKAGMDAEDVAAALDWGLSRVSGYVGINNHMGSAASADAGAMRALARELKARDLLVVDSRTTVKTEIADSAAAAGVPHTSRDVFLDNKKNKAAIRGQLRELARTAREQGAAVAIGHPYAKTLSVLESWIGEARRAGFAFVPVSAVVKAPNRDTLAGAAQTAAAPSN